MQICLIATNRLAGDPRAAALAHQLSAAGHTVTAVAFDTSPDELPFEVVWVSHRPPSLPGPVGRLIRKLLPKRVLDDLRSRALVAAARTSHADLYYPTTHDAVPLTEEAATRTGGAVARPPGFPAAATRDLIELAPSNPGLTPAAGFVARHHVPGWTSMKSPAPGRHNGRVVVLCYRRTGQSPGRYLEAALQRAGVEVIAVEGRLEWDDVPGHASGVVFVESPLPPVVVGGNPKPIPVAYWVHHGELHLAANLRLARLYGADVVLLAHSWHLAHRFAVPVERFPFAVPPELVDASKPWHKRRYDVAFVGAVRGTYERRRRLLAQLQSGFGDRAAIRSDVTPEEMAAVYAESRIVVNEGGSRHLPITMRVFEAIGSGAYLLTDPAPGLELFAPSTGYSILSDDAARQVGRLVDDPETAERAASTTSRFRSAHTYDHRVDELFAVLDRTEVDRTASRPVGPDSPIDIDVQRIAAWRKPDAAFGDVRDREIWDVSERKGDLAPNSFEAVLVGGDAGVPLDRILPAARRFIYATPTHTEAVAEWVRAHHPAASLTTDAGILRVDLHAEAYRI